MTPRPMDWVDASPVRDILRKVYWYGHPGSPARLTVDEFVQIQQAHPELFLHPVHNSLVQAGVLGVIFQKLVFRTKA